MANLIRDNSKKHFTRYVTTLNGELFYTSRSLNCRVPRLMQYVIILFTLNCMVVNNSNIECLVESVNIFQLYTL